MREARRAELPETDGSALTTSLATRSTTSVAGSCSRTPRSSASAVGGCAGSGVAGASSGSSIASLPGSKSAFEPASPGANTSDVPSLTSSGSDATATDAPLVENAMSPAASAAWTRRDTISSPVNEPASRSWRHTGQAGWKRSCEWSSLCRRWALRDDIASLPCRSGLASIVDPQLFGSATQRKAFPPAPVFGVMATLPTWSVTYTTSSCSSGRARVRPRTSARRRALAVLR